MDESKIHNGTTVKQKHASAMEGLGVRVNLEDYRRRTNSLMLEINNSDVKALSVLQTFHLS